MKGTYQSFVSGLTTSAISKTNKETVVAGAGDGSLHVIAGFDISSSLTFKGYEFEIDNEKRAFDGQIELSWSLPSTIDKHSPITDIVSIENFKPSALYLKSEIIAATNAAGEFYLVEADMRASTAASSSSSSSLADDSLKVLKYLPPHKYGRSSRTHISSYQNNQTENIISISGEDGYVTVVNCSSANNDIYDAFVDPDLNATTFMNSNLILAAGMNTTGVDFREKGKSFIISRRYSATSIASCPRVNSFHYLIGTSPTSKSLSQLLLFDLRMNNDKPLYDTGIEGDEMDIITELVYHPNDPSIGFYGTQAGLIGAFSISPSILTTTAASKSTTSTSIALSMQAENPKDQMVSIWNKSLPGTTFPINSIDVSTKVDDQQCIQLTFGADDEAIYSSHLSII